jgi:hypothetical protein
MKLEGAGVVLSDQSGSYELRLKFGPDDFCVVTLDVGEEQKVIAMKLRELAEQVERLS